MISLLNKFLAGELLRMTTTPAPTEPAKTRTYYVNAFRCKIKSNGQDACIIGLFDSNEWAGLPGLAKNLAGEYYLGAKLIAYYQVKTHPLTVNFYDRCGGVKICGKRQERVPILSRYKEKRLEAESEQEAIQMFTNFQFD
ncbi:MAG: hypothetical protein FWE32_05045 [Oscillospiraceae bacterium]|nr:hypothetical protein [Oscillospiraceae bacterium]